MKPWSRNGQLKLMVFPVRGSNFDPFFVLVIPIESDERIGLCEVQNSGALFWGLFVLYGNGFQKRTQGKTAKRRLEFVEGL